MDDKLTSGWTIKVTIPGQSPRVYAVGESDPKRALILANDMLATSPPRDRLETVGQVSHEMLERLGVSTGELKDVTNVSIHKE